MRPRGFIVLPLVLASFVLQADPPEVRPILNEIQAEPLRRDLSYIASDELEGRDSPSHGLDVAADYIANQFRAAGLEPGAGDSYFQNASMLVEEPDYSNFQLKLENGGRELDVNAKTAALRADTAIDLNAAPIFKLASPRDLAGKLTSHDLDGKVLVSEYQVRLPGIHPALTILIDLKGLSARGQRPRRLVEPGESKSERPTPRVTITGEAAAKFYASLKEGSSDANVTARIAAPHRTPAMMRNVMGILRGSDPALRESYVLLTAHYDHLGMRAGGSGDRIYNGANDDGSGTVSVMEIARALARLPKHPRRSIVFMTFFGEEEGLVGSEYYVRHPVLPLAKTVADLNLEQVGRTDSSEGPQLSNASLTGFDYSDITGFLERAGKSTGIRIYKNPAGSDNYFAASDNYSFAKIGVPAETLCVAFEFPDYHAVGDEWQKIDYGNMAKVDRAIALAVFSMADSSEPARWNERNPKTDPFVKAAKQRGLD